ncbi:MAG: methyltransferase domain-containing protein [Quisquiliibacterium sp.]
MGLYARHLLPRLTDCACGMAALNALRARVVPQAIGSVLEIGFGSGANLQWFDGRRVQRLLALEPSGELIRLARNKIARDGLPPGLVSPEFIAASAESIPLPDCSVDSIVMTYTMCSVNDPQRTAGELYRVLRPGGQVFYAEHGLAVSSGAQRWQQRLEPVWTALAGGCHLTREPGRLLRLAGFETTERQDLLGPSTRFWRVMDRLFPGYWGQAMRR